MNATERRARERIAALLSVASHPRTVPAEARTALEGARKAAEKAGLTDEYTRPFAMISFTIAMSDFVVIWKKAADDITGALAKFTTDPEEAP